VWSMVNIGLAGGTQHENVNLLKKNGKRNRNKPLCCFFPRGEVASRLKGGTNRGEGVSTSVRGGGRFG